MKITATNYDRFLKLTEQSGTNHVLLEDLAGTQYSATNAIYLQSIINDNKLDFDRSYNAKMLSPDPSTVKVKNDEQLKSLQIIRSNLFVQRAKLSNKFHTCKNDGQRRQNSQAIKLVQDQIKQNFENQEYYLKHKTLPSNDDQEIKIPKGKAELILAKASNASAISRYKSNLLTLAKLPAGNEKKKKIPEIEEKLRIKKNTLAAIKLALSKLQK